MAESMQTIAKLGSSGQQSPLLHQSIRFSNPKRMVTGGPSGTPHVYHPHLGLKTLDNHPCVCQKPLFFIAKTYIRDFEDSLWLNQCKPLPTWARLVNKSPCSTKIYVFPIQNAWLLGGPSGTVPVYHPHLGVKAMDNHPCVCQKPLFFITKTYIRGFDDSLWLNQCKPLPK